MTFESVDHGDEDEAQQPIKPARCRCYMPSTAMPPPVITAADQVRRNLRLSGRWARFGRLMVEQLLSEHDAAVERAETAEAQVKRMQAVINEDITAYEAELNDIHKARDHWQDETVRATERAENAEAERNAARRELAEVREQVGTPADPDDVFEPGHTYRSENGYFEFHCERRIGEYALGIETVLKDWPVYAGTRFYHWVSIGPSVGYTDVTATSDGGEQKAVDDV